MFLSFKHLWITSSNHRFSELNLIYPLQVQFRQDKNLISSLVTFNLTEHQLGPAEVGRYLWTLKYLPISMILQ